MNLQTEIADTEKALRDAGADLDKVLKAASVDRSTWTRWKNGSVRGARYDTMARVREAVATALASAPLRRRRGMTPLTAALAALAFVHTGGVIAMVFLIKALREDVAWICRLMAPPSPMWVTETRAPAAPLGMGRA